MIEPHKLHQLKADKGDGNSPFVLAASKEILQESLKKNTSIPSLRFLGKTTQNNYSQLS